MGGRWLSVVGAAEGSIAGVDALDPQTLSLAGGDRQAIAED